MAGVAHQIVRHAVLHGGDGDGRLQIIPGAQQFEAKRQVFGAPDAGVGIEVNAAVLLGAQFVEAGGQPVVLRRIGAGGAALGFRQQRVEGEWIVRRRLLGSGRLSGARTGGKRRRQQQQTQ